MPASRLSFLVVDDQPVLLHGVAAVVRTEFADSDVVEAGGYDEAVKLVGKKRLDVIVTDPHIGGLDATSSVAKLRRALDAPVVVFADDGDMRLLAQSLKAGARGCVRKDSSVDVLIDAITAVRGGAFYVDRSLAGQGESSDLALTDRQREILQMYADGFHTDRVAQVLGLSPETIRTHTKRILAKLSATTRTHAVAIGVREQILD